MGAFSEKWDKVDFSGKFQISDDLNDEDDHEVEDTDNEADPAIAAIIEEELKRGRS
ncbi:hypothetical protein ACFWPK_20685 [Nocardia sp. NPDC058519]|uniref:hypothetical protein n=1 Tax=unclassified Nocardia TaxID=2637762 RepID=UPI00364A163C